MIGADVRTAVVAAPRNPYTPRPTPNPGGEAVKPTPAGDSPGNRREPMSSTVKTSIAVGVALFVGCGQGADPVLEEPPTASVAVGETNAQDGFWAHLRTLCPGAAEGELLRAPEGDTQIDPSARLVVHFMECGEDEIRFPLHVDENRSRTWVFIRHPDALELRHDHRHPDGTEEANSWYGASTVTEGTATRQEFLSERDGIMVGWRVEVEPGQRFTYGTIRDGEWRHHLQFDLSTPAAEPPLPWGHETRPSQRPTPRG
jgi:hypothetical protein